MRVRPPSFGFLYLVSAIVAFVWFFVYLTRPMWWDLADRRERDLSEAAYLVRIASGGPEGRRGPWLSDALRLSARHEDWALSQRVLSIAQRQQIELDRNVLVEIEPEKCWVVGLDAKRWTHGSGSVAVVVHNDSEREVTLRMFWTSDRDGQGRVRRLGENWKTFAVQTGSETAVERVVPPRSTTWLEVCAAKAMFDGRNAKGRGIRLARVEVVP